LKEEEKKRKTQRSDGRNDLKDSGRHKNDRETESEDKSSTTISAHRKGTTVKKKKGKKKEENRENGIKHIYNIHEEGL
jgi:hypothetical protein